MEKRVGAAGLILCALLAYVCSVISARDMGLHQSEPTNRMRFHAIPVAISQLYHGRPHDYTAYWSIAMPFHSTRPIAELIRDAVAAEAPENDKTYFWTADDRGLSDFVYFSFLLFGPTLKSLFYFWFMLLGVSLGAALIRFNRDLMALSVSAAGMIAIGFTLPIFTRAGGINFQESSIHLSESRLFDVLGAIAALHLILTMFSPISGRRIAVVTLTSQLLLLSLLLHARSSVGWLFAAIILLSLGLAAMRVLASKPWRNIAQTLQPAALLVLCWVGVHTYQHVAFHPAYKEGIGPRTVWHNALIGLAISSEFAEGLGMRAPNDRSAVEAVLSAMKKRNDSRLRPDWTVDNVLNSLGSHTTFDWRTYEDVARDLVLESMRSDLWGTFWLAFWDKPAELTAVVFCDLLGRTEYYPTRICAPPRQVPSLPFWSWGLLYGSVLLSFLAGKCRVDRGFGPLLFSIAWMALFGLVPALAFYPAVTQIGGALVFMCVTVQVAFLFLLSLLARHRRVH